MTKQILAVAAALLFTALAPVTSHAQQPTQAKVPFAFQAGSKLMPAGEYRVQRASSATTTNQLIRSTDSSASTFVLTNAIEDHSDKNTDARLIFHCYNNQAECFLSEVWNGNGQGLKLIESRREKELSRAASENELAVVSVPLTVTP
ncbi:MAG: hypothetical protein WAL95_11220 [Candidatus Acidiferrales bacterium]